ncbi:DUF4192 family protein [Kineococcus sp. TBRC 1896]|uniref:DUF4192 family protein n=1 Tax=Kineococcus mangrovi TaxID=1660183 RepID=A0ABV4I4G5_9ACTN
MPSTSRPTPPGAPPPLPVSGPAELLAVLPHLLGFHPADSVLLVELSAPDGGTGRRSPGLLVRADLPAAADGPASRAAARAVAEECLRLVRRVARPGSELLVVLHAPDARATPAVLLPGARAAATSHALRSGLEALRDAGAPAAGDHLLVGAGRWRTLTCSGPCCPPGGQERPVTAAASGGVLRVRAEAVWRGFAAAPDRAASLPPSTPADPDRCARAAAARRAPVPPAEARDLVATFDRAVQEAVAGPAPVLDAGWCGRLLRALEQVGVRDAVLLSGCRGPGTRRARRHLLRPEGAAAAAGGAEHPARALVQEVDPVRAGAAADLAVQVARCGGSRGGAQAWAVAGWLERVAGRPVRAGACAEQALRQDPRHRLAGLLDGAVRHGPGPSALVGAAGAAPAPALPTGAGGPVGAQARA